MISQQFVRPLAFIPPVVKGKELRFLKVPGLDFTHCHRSAEDAPIQSPAFPPWATGAAAPAEVKQIDQGSFSFLQPFILSSFVLLL